MPKESGVGIDALYIDGFDLTGDTGAIQTIAVRRAPLEVTGLDKLAPERILGLQDGELTFNSWYNPATPGQEHPVLSTLPTADRIVSYFHGSTPGTSPAAGLTGKQIDYQSDRGADGALALTTQILANGSGVDWGDMLTTGKQSFGAAGAGTAFDYTVASTAFGAVAYLHVFAVTGTSVTVAVQDSVDSTPGNFANITGLAFTAVTSGTGHAAQRLATPIGATIRRWVRINLTGTFSNATIAVLFRKFEMAQT
jgi:hypothetical protein